MLEGQSAAYAEQILSAASDWAFWLVETVMAELQKLKKSVQQLPLNIIQQMWFSPSRQILSSNIHGTIKLCNEKLHSIVLNEIKSSFFSILHSFSVIFPRLYIDFALTSRKGYCHQRGKISERLV